MLCNCLVNLVLWKKIICFFCVCFHVEKTIEDLEIFIIIIFLYCFPEHLTHSSASHFLNLQNDVWNLSHIMNIFWKHIPTMDRVVKKQHSYQWFIYWKTLSNKCILYQRNNYLSGSKLFSHCSHFVTPVISYEHS